MTDPINEPKDERADLEMKLVRYRNLQRWIEDETFLKQIEQLVAEYEQRRRALK